MRKREKCEIVDFCVIFIKNALFAFLPPKTIRKRCATELFPRPAHFFPKAHIFMKSVILRKKLNLGEKCGIS